MILDFVPSFILDLIKEKPELQLAFNSNYYVRSSCILEVHPISVFNFLSKIENEMNWRNNIIEVNQSQNSFSRIFNQGVNQMVENFSRTISFSDKTMIMSEYNENDIINIYRISSVNNYSACRIEFLSLVNNAFPYFYFNSILTSLLTFRSFLKFQIQEMQIISSKPEGLIDKDN